jgi:hypothetical protein
MVATMKVLPTRNAAHMTARIPGQMTGRTTPTAIATWLEAQRRRLPTNLEHPAAAKVAATDAAPKIGHVQPKTAGSWTTSRPSMGRKVAGIMYPKPQAP